MVRAGASKSGKRNTDQEIARLRQRTNAVQKRQNKEDILAYLDSFPELGAGCLRHLQDAAGGRRPKKRGAAQQSESDDDDDDEQPPEEPTHKFGKKRNAGTAAASAPIATPPLKRRPTSSPSVAGSKASMRTSLSDENFRAGIPKCYTIVLNIPPKYLYEAISNMGEISLSKNSMRGMTGHGAKLPTKERLLEVFEALTGLEPEDNLEPELHNMDNLAIAMKTRHHCMNRWARDLRFPATWRTDGIYSCRTETKKLYITHRPLNKEIEVTPSLLANVKDITGMYLDKNYSERRAQLTDVNGAFRMMVMVACPGMAEIASVISSKDIPEEEDEDIGEGERPAVEPGDAGGHGGSETATGPTPAAAPLVQSEVGLAPPVQSST